MNLKELKKMIAEEYSAYTQEVKEQDMPEMPGMPSVNVGPGDIDVAVEENPEETLRAIYDMLKDYFEGDDKADDAGDADDADADDADADDADDEAPKDAALQERFQKLANIIKG